MKNSISISDFGFIPSGYGHYKVTYTSPVTGKTWTKTTDNMPLIDKTKNANNAVKNNEANRLRVAKHIASKKITIINR